MAGSSITHPTDETLEQEIARALGDTPDSCGGRLRAFLEFHASEDDKFTTNETLLHLAHVALHAMVTSAHDEKIRVDGDAKKVHLRSSIVATIKANVTDAINDSIEDFADYAIEQIGGAIAQNMETADQPVLFGRVDTGKEGWESDLSVYVDVPHKGSVSEYIAILGPVSDLIAKHTEPLEAIGGLERSLRSARRKLGLSD